MSQNKQPTVRSTQSFSQSVVRSGNVGKLVCNHAGSAVTSVSASEDARGAFHWEVNVYRHFEHAYTFTTHFQLVEAHYLSTSITLADKVQTRPLPSP